MLSLNVILLLSLILFTFLPTALAAGPGRGSEPPEQPHEEPPVVIVDPNPAGNPQGSPAPFPEPESTEGPDFSQLADNIQSLIEDIISLFAPTTTSSSTPPLSTAATTTKSDSNSNGAAPSVTAISTSPAGKLNATLACEVYQAYTSLCPPIAATPYNLGVVGGITLGANAAEASDIARASCLCYSSAYWVPNVYDDVAWACAAYTTDKGDSNSADATLAAAATAAAALPTQTPGFCASVGPVRPGATFATFGEFTAAAVTSTSMPAPTPGVTSAPGGSTGAAGRLFAVRKEAWAQAAAVAVVAALV